MGRIGSGARVSVPVFKKKIPAGFCPEAKRGGGDDLRVCPEGFDLPPHWAMAWRLSGGVLNS